MNWQDRIRLRILDAMRMVIGGWAVIFTDATRRDSHRTYFDERTRYDLEAYDRRPTYWHHALPTPDNPYGFMRIGNVLTLEAREQDGIRGLWGESQIEQEFWERISADITQRAVGWTSAVVPGTWRQSHDGHIENWPIAELSASPESSLFSYRDVGALRLDLGGVDLPVPDNLQLETRSVFAFSAPPAPSQVPQRRLPVQQFQGQMTPGGVVVPEGSSLEGSRRSVPIFQVADHLDEYTLDDLAFGLQLEQTISPGVPLHLNTRVGERVLRAFGERLSEEIEADQSRVGGSMRVTFDEADMQSFLDRLREAGGSSATMRADEVSNLTTTGYGDDFVPTVLSAMAWRNFREKSTVLSLFEVVDFDSSPADWPTVGASPRVRRGTELNDITNVNRGNPLWPTRKVGTDKVTFTAGELVWSHTWSERQQLFSKVDVVREWRQSAEEAFVDGIDWAILHGDKNATATNISHHGVDPTGTEYDSALIVSGLRYNCLVTLTANATNQAAGAPVYTDPHDARKLMSGGKGHDLPNLVHILDETSMYKFEVMSQVVTVDLYGPNATILTGELGKLFGVPMIHSQQMELVSQTAGKIGYMSSTHNDAYGSMLTIWRPAVKIGRFKRLEFVAGRVQGGYWLDANIMIDVGIMDTDAIVYDHGWTV